MTTIETPHCPSPQRIDPIEAVRDEGDPRSARPLTGLRNALLRRVRGVAIRVLDLETEFEAVD